ncbi:hypothetical protein PI172_2403 [Prevotella intermedia]|uniref:Uncharacterized protein n=1 Tax=Prevotella intermedia TaxID=28131 RepID=A0AAD1F8L8_PREIN|nr:hypothetical protein PI172_2403 [Prevotella intermedia]
MGLTEFFDGKKLQATNSLQNITDGEKLRTTSGLRNTLTAKSRE